MGGQKPGLYREEARWRTIVFVCRSISLRDAFKLDVITDVTVLRL